MGGSRTRYRATEGERLNFGRGGGGGRERETLHQSIEIAGLISGNVKEPSHRKVQQSHLVESLRREATCHALWHCVGVGFL